MPKRDEAKKANLTSDLIRAMQKMPGNDTCADCPTPNPDWASVNHGCMVCLNCSGTHRSIGVHLSFVRSVFMDKWAAEEIDLMLRQAPLFMDREGTPIGDGALREGI